jgi:hypothetical protein
MIAIATLFNGNIYKSGKLHSVAQRSGYFLLISRIENEIPVAEIIINKSEIKTLRTIDEKGQSKYVFNANGQAHHHG